MVRPSLNCTLNLLQVHVTVNVETEWITSQNHEIYHVQRTISNFIDLSHMHLVTSMVLHIDVDFWLDPLPHASAIHRRHQTYCLCLILECSMYTFHALSFCASNNAFSTIRTTVCTTRSTVRLVPLYDSDANEVVTENCPLQSIPLQQSFLIHLQTFPTPDCLNWCTVNFPSYGCPCPWGAAPDIFLHLVV